MAVGRDGNLWAGRADGSVVVFSANDHLEGVRADLDNGQCLGPVQTLSIVEYSVLQCCDGSHHSVVTQISREHDEDGAVWCAVSTGLLVRFDARTQQRTRVVKLDIPSGSFYAPQNRWTSGVSGVHELFQEPGITDLLNGSTAMPERRFAPAAMLLVGDAIWIGTGRHLIVHNATDAKEAKDATNTDDETVLPPSPKRYDVRKGKLSMNGRRRFVVECNSTLCMVMAKGGEVWSCAPHDPYMVVWDASRPGQPLKKTEFAVPWGERGIARLMSEIGCVWAACRDGSVIVWDATTKNTIMNVRDSAIPITLLCSNASRDKTEVFGMAKGAAYTVVVWKA
jgi:hypothetical protein